MDYASKTIPKLPNFFATRDTTRFEDTPAELPHNTTDTVKYEPLHAVANSSVTVLYRDGRELVDAGGGKRKQQELPNHELSAAGEFGPILSTVLVDASQGKVTWSHWEQGATGPMAVFRYPVGKEASHYTVIFPGITRDTTYVPPYHGEIAVNPADGSILRLTMVAELKATDPVAKADLLVDYGPVEIGGSTYICPVKSVALSLVREIRVTEYNGNKQTSVGPLQTGLNDVVFKQYHLFRAEVRILNGEDAEPAGSQPASVPAGAPPGIPATSPQR